MNLQEKALQAAKTVLTQCLALPAGAPIVIFSDETLLDTSSIINKAAIELELQPTVTYFTTHQQQTRDIEQTKHRVDTLLDGVVATLNCLNGSPEFFPFREMVRETALDRGGKVAHMPDVDLQTLLLADVDYREITRDCEMLALALAKGKEIEIITTDRHGNEHSLRSKLQPWERLPTISDGIIQKGAWGNVPSGETYISPPEGEADGSIVINGSVRGYPMSLGEEIVLHFRHGRLTAWKPTNHPAAKHLYETQIRVAQAQGDQNWSNLAEIGLGANRLVNKLTGNPLLDEKKYGTLHIALGDSIDMGGAVSSLIHCDMVCLFPQVLVDGKRLLDEGKVVVDPHDWREDYKSIQLNNSWHQELRVKQTVTEAEITGTGELKRLWDTSSGRVCSVPVGDEATSQLAARLYKSFEKIGRPVPIHNLFEHQKEVNLQTTMQLLHILQQYGLVDVGPIVS